MKSVQAVGIVYISFEMRSVQLDTHSHTQSKRAQTIVFKWTGNFNNIKVFACRFCLCDVLIIIIMRATHVFVGFFDAHLWIHLFAVRSFKCEV